MLKNHVIFFSVRIDVNNICIKACFQNKAQHCASSACISGLRCFLIRNRSKYKQTTVRDKSGHGCGRFNEIKANRITTQRHMYKTD